MFGTNYWQRINVFQLCHLLRTNSILHDAGHDGTPEERYTRYTKALSTGSRSFRDEVLNFDWENYERCKDMKTETMFADIFSIVGSLNDLCYDMGFVSGIKIGQDIADLSNQIRPE